MKATGKGDKQRIVPAAPRWRVRAGPRLARRPGARRWREPGQRRGAVPQPARHADAARGAIRRMMTRHLRTLGEATSVVAARAAAHVRHAPARERRRPAHRAGAARSRCAVYHPNLYSREREAPSGRARTARTRGPEQQARYRRGRADPRRRDCGAAGVRVDRKRGTRGRRTSGRIPPRCGPPTRATATSTPASSSSSTTRRW